jgi:hypothetical protein
MFESRSRQHRGRSPCSRSRAALSLPLLRQAARCMREAPTRPFRRRACTVNVGWDDPLRRHADPLPSRVQLGESRTTPDHGYRFTELLHGLHCDFTQVAHTASRQWFGAGRGQGEKNRSGEPPRCRPLSPFMRSPSTRVRRRQARHKCGQGSRTHRRRSDGPVHAHRAGASRYGVPDRQRTSSPSGSFRAAR